MVLDLMKEWGSVPRNLSQVTGSAYSVDDASKMVSEGAKLVIVRPAESIEVATEQACVWARDLPKGQGGGEENRLCGVACPEAHNAMPNKGRLPLAVRDIITAWRHHHVAMWADTQRISLLSTHVVELSYVLKVFAQIGRNDKRILEAIGDKELVEAVKQCAVNLENGEPGWHVKLGPSRLGPYTVVRDEMR